MTPSLVRKIRDDKTAAYTVEFALIAPLFLTFLFGIFETGIVLLRSMNLEAATQSGSDYVVNSMITDKAATEAQLRSVIRSEIAFKTASDDLKVSLTKIDTNNLNDLNVTFPIANRFDVSSTKNQTYVLAVGYDVYPILPWTALLIPYRGAKPQIQSVALINTSVKVTG